MPQYEGKPGALPPLNTNSDQDKNDVDSNAVSNLGAKSERLKSHAHSNEKTPTIMHDKSSR